MVSMRNERSKEVFSYWDSLRLGEPAPKRAQVNPAELRHRLSDLFILDQEGESLNFRLAGTRICDLFDRELRGNPFEVLWDGPSRAVANRAAQLSLRTERPVVMTLSVAACPDYPIFETLLLPLRSGAGRADRLLASLLPLGRLPTLRPLALGAFRVDHWQLIDMLALAEKLEAMASADRRQ
ncbi:PAS domain-containing protein [Rhizobium sp. SGZ-381]|uniref:PAS domain-containing protein n=1 Tax=Rhizobium sp. SGZ-381 TaxID=3342800 RepID=UPI00366AE9AD